jgi:hypothetical protein
MFELTIARQRRIVLSVQIILLAALVVEPVYVAIDAIWGPFERALPFVPGLCFVAVTVAAALSVWIEQTTANDAIRTFTLHQIGIFLTLVLLGLFSATQTSVWWRITTRGFVELINLIAIAFAIALPLLTAHRLREAIRQLPRS